MDVLEMLAGDAGLAGIHWALLGRPARKALRVRLRALLTDNVTLGPCRLHRTKFKPSRKLSANYNVRLDDQGTNEHSIRPIAVTWTLQAAEDQHGPTQPLSALQAEALRRGVAAPFRQLMADDPAWRMHIQISPLDGRFPQLVRLSDPQHVRQIIASAYRTMPDASSLEPAAPYTVTPIRYRPGQRHVLRYDPVPTDEYVNGGRAVFAKLYTEEEAGARSFRLMTRVADWLATYGDGVKAVRPLAHLADDMVVLYPQMLGKPLSQHLRYPGQAVARYLRHAGRALQSLHSAPESLTYELELRPFTAEVQSIARASEHVHALLPAAGVTIREILDRAQELNAHLPQESPTFVHGDFKADHLLVTPAGLTVLDFDSCSLADPAYDVGKFLADLQWWYAAHHQPGLAQAQDRFLIGYGLDPLHARIKRARLYEALILVKITVRRVPLLDHDWARRTMQLIECAERILGDVE